MKIYVYPSDVGGCGYYRLIWPAKVLQGMGHTVRIVHPRSKNRITGGVGHNGRLATISVPKDADVMVFQRVSSRFIVDGIQTMREHGVAVIVDIDDDLASIHPSNPAFEALHPYADHGDRTGEYSWENAMRACAAATMVTTSTPALLKRYAPHGRGRVLYNCVPKVMTDIVPTPEYGVVGWTGTFKTHSDDPQVVGTAMTRIQREGYRFKMIGPAYGIRSAFQLDDEPMATELMVIGDYPHEVKKLQVGVAPLNDTRFNAAKSWLKMLEFAALGVACVGSPRAEYTRIHNMGVGLLANNPREWYRHVRRLLEDEPLRTELTQRGRQVVRERLTIEDNAWRWLETWSDALAFERGPLGQKPTVGSVHNHA